MNHINESLDKGISQILSRWTNGICPGGQVLIRQNKKVIYESCFGYANLEHQIPITQDTIFHIASISKQFTVLAVLLLQEEGKLNVEDDIRKYVADLISFQEPVTLSQLFHNVSGIRDQWELLFMRGIKINDSIDMEDVNTSLKLQKTLNFPPQEGYLYSNTGFHLLSVIVERVSQMSFPDFVKERIFKPLGMENTFIRKSSSQVISHLALSYQDEGCGTYFYNPLNYSLYGPTAVNTCAKDLIKILEEYENPRYFSKTVLDTIFTPAHLKDGTEIEYCGGMMTHMWRGFRVYEHGGADAAYRGQLFWIPEQQLQILLLGNTNTYMASKAAKDIAALVLGLEKENTTPEEGKLSAPTAGVYLTEAPDDPVVMEIFLKDGIFYQKREYADTPLILQENGSYRIGSLDEYLAFLPHGLEHRLPAKTVFLRPALESNSSLPISCGNYKEEETDCHMVLENQKGALTISHKRYGTAFVYTADGRTGLFSFNPDFTMYLVPCEKGLELNGYRALHMMLRKS